MTRLGRPNAGLKARTTRTLRQPCFRPSRAAASFVLAVGVSPRSDVNRERSRGAAVSTWFPVEGRGFSRAKTCAWEIGLSAPALIPWLKPYRLRPWFAGLKPSPSTGSFALTHGTPGWEPRALIARCFARWYKLARTEPRSGGGALRPGREPRSGDIHCCTGAEALRFIAAALFRRAEARLIRISTLIAGLRPRLRQISPQRRCCGLQVLSLAANPFVTNTLHTSYFLSILYKQSIQSTDFRRALFFSRIRHVNTIL